jgi:hypothetical protein
MSYYTLPKINNIFDFFPSLDEKKSEIYTSHSLFYYYTEYNNNRIPDFDNLLTIINSHEYIFTKIPIYNYSISKLKNKSNLFYDLLEILNVLNILDPFTNLIKINSIHISENFDESVECVNFLREINNDNNMGLTSISPEIYNIANDENFDFIFYDIKPAVFEDLNEYCLSMLQILMVIFKCQSNNGNCIIKINHVFYKPIIDILYILSSIYEKIVIIKPNTSNIISFDKYVVCKNFIFNENKKNIYENYYLKITEFIYNYGSLKGNNISSIIKCDIPYFFINKIDDINIIFGQQQLESFDQINNIFKNKNKEEKIETIKKGNIQKSSAWCEKFKIPYNKFSDKINMFLPLKTTFENVI